MENRAGSRDVSGEGIARSSDGSEDCLEDFVIQIGDIIAMWVSFF